MLSKKAKEIKKQLEQGQFPRITDNLEVNWDEKRDFEKLKKCHDRRKFDDGLQYQEYLAEKVADLYPWSMDSEQLIKILEVAGEPFIKRKFK